jgi:hypothetical protein
MEESSRRSQEEAQQRQEEAQQRQALLEQQLREHEQMMNWFMNQAVLASPLRSLPTPPFVFSWVSG